MSLFALGAFLEFIMNPSIVGPNELLIKMYYLTVGPQVSLLGTGVLLLISSRWGIRVLCIVVAMSALLLLLGALVPIDISDAIKGFQSSVVFGVRDAARSFARPVRLLTIGLNIYGAFALIGGSLLSFILDRRRTYALLIAIGGSLNAIGGALLGIFGNPDIFLEFEFLGAAALSAGFLMSYRFTAPTRRKATEISLARWRPAIPHSRRYALAAIFGAVIFISKIFAPTPIKHSMVLIQALLLGLAALLLSPLGATFVSTIAGLLSASWSSELAVFTLTFAIGYGLLIDGLIWIFKARRSNFEVDAPRFTLAITFSTAIIGLVAYWVTVVLGLLPRNPVAEILILIGGVLSGLAGGYLSVVIWRRAARYFAG